MSAALRIVLALAFPLATVVVCAAAPEAESAPTSSSDIIAAARALVEARRLPEAREPLEKLLAREPGNLAAALVLAHVYDRMGRRDDAIALLEPFIEKHPNDAKLLGLYAGTCLLRAGELGASFRAIGLARKGRDFLEKAVALDPSDIAYREGLVDFYRQAPGMVGGSLAKARAHADEIAKIDPVRGAAWQAAILVQEGRHDEALTACEAALKVRPDDYVALYTFGKTASESGRRLAEGEAALRRCLELTPRPSEPSHAGVWNRIGLIAEKRGDLPAARAAYRAALKLEPSFPRPAEALKRIGESD